MTVVTHAQTQDVAIDSTPATALKIAFIGGGNMAQALIGGLLAKGFSVDSICVAEPVLALHARFTEKGIRVVSSAPEAVTDADVVVMAVKPQVMSDVLAEMKAFIADPLIISIAAGIPLSLFTSALARAEDTPYARVIRAMPNTPALVQAGATGLYASDAISQADQEIASYILSSAGLVLWVKTEAELHAVTAVSGSGPAYFFYMMEAMINAGIDAGLTPETARALTLQTAFGASKMALESTESPAQLRKNVTSPNGTTQSAIESMDSNQVKRHIEEAVRSASLRSEALAKQLG